jgi:hypothetical protein
MPPIRQTVDVSDLPPGAGVRTVATVHRSQILYFVNRKMIEWVGWGDDFVVLPPYLLDDVTRAARRLPTIE